MGGQIIMYGTPTLPPPRQVWSPWRKAHPLACCSTVSLSESNRGVVETTFPVFLISRLLGGAATRWAPRWGARGGMRSRRRQWHIGRVWGQAGFGAHLPKTAITRFRRPSAMITVSSPLYIAGWRRCRTRRNILAARQQFIPLPPRSFGFVGAVGLAVFRRGVIFCRTT
jgi:hypothetical protein